MLKKPVARVLDTGLVMTLPDFLTAFQAHDAACGHQTIVSYQTCYYVPKNL